MAVEHRRRLHRLHPLEARRLLCHTDLPPRADGARLGFPDATVFTRFFRRRTGETRAAFRARARGTGEDRSEG
ncbi:hypothetical protein AV521_03350 [Streptomyces sp. IMTB 2501]|uniref:hypothetical protein n=1 Tax=Streptomyces sp. IMTB 2501 TaxID=1776340 RepID=UPI00096F3517|nr:hypothetical protein [Streptomyces sp. IMTB 2501]OLZ74650.1 hypothetical protein AV521_03350 [Streptomyces sp. IMTB 2501]